MKALITSTGVVMIETRDGFRSPDGFSHSARAWDLWSDDDWRQYYGPTAKVVPINDPPAPQDGDDEVGRTYAVAGDGNSVDVTLQTTTRPIETVKERLRARISRKALAAESDPYTVGSTVIRMDDRGKMLLLLAKESNATAVIIQDASGAYVSLSSSQINALVRGMANRVNAVNANAAALIAAVEGATSIANARAVDLNSGW